MFCLWRRALAGVFLTAGLVASPAYAALIVSDFTGTAPGVNTPWTQTSVLDPNLVFGGWRRGAGVNGDATVHNEFGFTISGVNTHESTLDEALAQNEYLGFTLAPQPSQTMNLSGARFSFSINRTDMHGPRQFVVFTSLGGFTQGAQIFTTQLLDKNKLQIYHFSFLLPLSGFDGLTAPLEFRIYCVGVIYASKKCRLNAFSLIEPSGAYSALTLGATDGGAISSIPAATVFDRGTTVSIIASPHPGYRFAGWQGDLSGKLNPRSLVMTSDKAVTATFAPNPPPQMWVGTNLGGIADYTSDWPFVDWIKKLRPWQTRNIDDSGAWNSGYGNLAPTDADGWPTQIPFDPGDGSMLQFCHSVVTVRIPGTYHFDYEGSGILRFRPGGSAPWVNLPSGGKRSYTFTLASVPASLFFELRETALPPDHLKNFKLVTPGHDGTEEAFPFQPLYVERLSPFCCYRFMDWGDTNGSPLVGWNERTTTHSYTQARAQGVAVEYMARLCNQTRKDAWICIPHKADDNYVRQTARFFRDHLDPVLRLYVEYSNETWNGMFSQTGYCSAQGLALGLDSDSWRAGQKYVALRSVQIWEIFEQEYGTEASERLIKVMATQSAGASVTDLRIEGMLDESINPNHISADALAIAPYFGVIYKPADIPPTAPAYPTVDEVVTTLSIQRIAAVRSQVVAQKARAHQQGWDLICYEGGQHFVGSNGAENNDTLTAILIAANRDPRMYDRYIEYLDMLKAEGVEMFANFSYCGAPSKWGSWGVLEYQEQPVADAPKYRALIDWIAANPVPVTLSGFMIE